MSKQETSKPPFTLPLTDTIYAGLIADQGGEVASARAPDISAPDCWDVIESRRDCIIMCVNAHERLAEYARRYRAVCEVERLNAEENGLDVLESSWADDIREIDAALAEPAAGEDQP